MTPGENNQINAEGRKYLQNKWPDSSTSIAISQGRLFWIKKYLRAMATKNLPWNGPLSIQPAINDTEGNCEMRIWIRY